MRTLLLSLLLLFAEYVHATQITGRVLLAPDNIPAEHAQVILYRNETVIAHASANVTGQFTLSAPVGKGYLLQIRVVGFDIDQRPIEILENKKGVDIGVCILKELELGLGEVEVVASKRQVIYKLDKRVIDAGRSLKSAGGTAIDILEHTPSIRIDVEGGVTFRGSTQFRVYIDGKPSLFSGAQALEQVPASNIENIEIITTPSAQYEAEGDVGIINIITKKQSGDGWSGNINVIGSSVATKGIDMLLSYAKGASQYYIGAEATNRIRRSDFEQEKTTIVGDTTTQSISKGPRLSNNYNYAARVGWKLNTQPTAYYAELGAGYVGRIRQGDLDYKEQQYIGATPNNVWEQFSSRDDYDLHETYGQGTIGFDHLFSQKGHSLSGKFYLKYGGNALEYFESDLQQGYSRAQGHKAWEAEHRWSIRGNLDYAWPYAKQGVLNAGYSYFMYSEHGDYSMDYWNPTTNVYDVRNDIYSTFLFLRGINAVYATATQGIGNWNIKAGLRGEHTHQILRSNRAWANRTVNKPELFPSLHIGYTLPNEHRLTAAYSRRTNRPELFYMEPYLTFRDYYTAEIGNPDIRPEYINAYELNYSKQWDNASIATTVFHRTRKDKFERLRIPYKAGITLDSMANVGNDYATGMELSGNVQIFKWWNTTLNGSLYHYEVENLFKTEGKDETSINYDVAWSNTFDIARYTRLQLDGNFVGPSVSTQGRTESYYYMSMAVRQQFWKRRIVGTLSINDLFGTAHYVSIIDTPSLVSTTRIRPAYPLISLSVSYTFNNFKNKGGTTISNDRDIFEGTNH